MHPFHHSFKFYQFRPRISLLLVLVIGFALNGLGQVNAPTNANAVPGATAGKTPDKPTAYPSNEVVNYMRTWAPKQPNKSLSSVIATTNTVSQIDITTEYSDGFGRPLQSVKWQTSPTGGDLVTPHTYDPTGRESDMFLTYASPSSAGSLKTNPFGEQSTFYSSTYLASEPDLANENFYYTESLLEASPLNRELAKYKAGNSWVGSNVGSQTQYLLNSSSDQVQIWNITSNGLTYVNNDISTNIPATSAVYQPGTLTNNVTIDENGNQVQEFKDEDGLTVLKKVQVAAVSAGAPYTNWLSTYFVYDDLGRQRFVIPPKATAAMVASGNWNLTTDMINELCYRYEYDPRGRMIAKKAPGGAWMYTVYDQMNRPVFVQDGKMRSNNQWLATIYDGLDRVVETAVITYSSGQVALQSYVSSNTGLTTVAGQAVTGSYLPTAILVNDPVPLRVAGVTQYLATNSITFQTGFTSEAGANFIAEIVTGGDASTPTTANLVPDNPMPAGANPVAMVLNYYDNYTNTSKTYNTTNNAKLDQGANPYADPIPAAKSILTAGLLTSTKVRVIENATNLSLGIMLETANFYDDKGRTIQAQSDNYKGGVDYTTSRYDFANKVVCAYLAHNNPAASVANFTVKTNIDYDVSGRKVEIRKTINDDNTKTRILEYDQYDALGMLSVRKLGQKSDVNGNVIPISSPATDNTNWLEIDNNIFTINGWLKGTNWNYGSGPTSSLVNYQNKKWFGMDLSFDWGFNTKQLNGNIAGQRWVSAGDGKERAYGYGYDAADRLLKADFAQNFGGGTSPIWATSDPNSSFTIDFSVKMGDGQNAASAYDANGNILQMQQMGLVLNSRQQIDNLIYTYENNQISNKIRAVADQSGSTAILGDFTDNNTTADDYGYDLNGNLITDLNKRIPGNIGVDQSSGGGIIYSYKNLPWQVSAKNPDGTSNGTITFIYDANGRRLEKRTNVLASSFNNNTASNTVNSYLGPFVYTNNALQYFTQENGRVRPTSNTNQPYAYDYFLKDHLQNCRVILTDEQQQIVYPVATVEEIPSNSLSVEQANYEINTADITLMAPITGYNGNYPNNNGNPPYNTNPNSNTSAQSSYMYRLNGATGDKTGLGITIKVMTGDQVNIWGKAFYHLNGTITNTYTINSTTAALNSFIGAFAATPVIAAGAHEVTAGALQSSPVTPNALNSLLGSVPTPTGAPKAYINWILFDEQFRPVNTGTNSGFLSVGSNPDQIVPLSGTATITTSGYLYVYCSNESNNDVYFDNLQVIQNRGPLLEENHYYPFGLTMAGLASKVVKTNYTENKRKFSAQELDDDLNLDWYQFEFRDHDPQIGRFHQIDPAADKYQANSTYAYAENRPINGTDQEGKEFEWYNAFLNWYMGYYVLGQSIRSDVNSNFNASTNNLGRFDQSQGSNGISQQVQDNQMQAQQSRAALTNDLVNLEYNELNDAMTIYGFAVPEAGALHMIVQGGLEKNYFEMTLGVLTYGVGGAFQYLANDLQAAASTSDAMARYNSMTDFSEGVRSVLLNNDIGFDNLGIYGNDYNNQFIVLGRNMDGRVIPAVKALQDVGVDAEYWTGFDRAKSVEDNLAANQQWLQGKLAQGYNVIDVGLDPFWTAQGSLDPGLFYGMESNTIPTGNWTFSIQLGPQ